MNVIAINEYKNDFPVAVVQIPDGKTAEETFVMWVRKHGKASRDWSDQQVLEEALFCWEELKVEQVP